MLIGFILRSIGDFLSGGDGQRIGFDLRPELFDNRLAPFPTVFAYAFGDFLKSFFGWVLPASNRCGAAAVINGVMNGIIEVTSIAFTSKEKGSTATALI
ncbi:MAG: hypothetical protein AB7P14_21105 [Blastocatellales bacterium]